MSYIELCLTRFDQLHEENLKYTVLVFFMLADPVLQADNDTAWRTDDGQIPHIRSKLQIIIWFFSYKRLSDSMFPSCSMFSWQLLWQ